MEQKSVFDPVVERLLLRLHRAVEVDSFWKATRQLLSVAIPSRVVRLTLQHSPLLPRVVKWTRPFPNGFFAAEPLKHHLVAQPRPRMLRISDLFPNRSSLKRSDFFRRYLEPHNCLHGVILLFWRSARLLCGITILRTAAQGNLSRAEMGMLRHLHPQFLTALLRLGPLERERSLRSAFEEFIGRLPLPTIVLRWSLTLVYQNQAARDFCALWEKGPRQARLTKPRSPVPSEILECCRELKGKWTRAKRSARGPRSVSKEQVHHPRRPHLRAVIRLRQLTSAGVAQPHFLIECEDLRQPAGPGLAPKSRLQHMVQLTSREREVAHLVCDGQSNQEIADEAGLSLPTVKQHVHAIFRKLEVSSRSRLITLMR